VSTRRAIARLVFTSEMRRLLRDRRAFFSAVVLPVLLYPLLFLGTDVLEREVEDSLDEEVVLVLHDFEGLPWELAERVLAALETEDGTIRLEPAEEGLARRLAAADDAEARELFATGEQELLVHAVGPGPGREASADAPEDDGAEDRPPPPAIELVTDRSDTRSRVAHERVSTRLAELDRRIFEEELVSLVGSDPALPFQLAERDVARAEDASGRALGKLLPLLAVLVIVAGGSFAALDTFAGEREAGTLETLLVQPAPSIAIASGKFAAVLATALASLVGNAASFLACVQLGLGDLPALGAGDLGATGLRLALGLVLFVPTAVLIAAALSLVSARARSFREGQYYVFPVVLASAAPAALATLERVELGWGLAWLPVAGPSLALRDALAGSLAVGPAALAALASAGWGWLALRRLARTLDAERLLATRASAEESAARRDEARRALAAGLAAVLAVWIVGARLQASWPIAGLVATIAGILPAIALVAARGYARRNGTTLAGALGLGAPRPADLAAALLCAPALALFVRAVFALQERLLPSPELALPAEIAELGPTALLVLLCLLPGFFEELLFRGALVTGLARDLRPWRVCLWQAVLFGAVHLSVYRFLPTGLVGAALAALVLRTRSIWPAVVLHSTYNALLVLGPDPEATARAEDARGTALRWLDELHAGSPLGLALAALAAAIALGLLARGRR